MTDTPTYINENDKRDGDKLFLLSMEKKFFNTMLLEKCPKGKHNKQDFYVRALDYIECLYLFLDTDHIYNSGTYSIEITNTEDKTMKLLSTTKLSTGELVTVNFNNDFNRYEFDVFNDGDCIANGRAKLGDSFETTLNKAIKSVNLLRETD